MRVAHTLGPGTLLRASPARLLPPSAAAAAAAGLAASSHWPGASRISPMSRLGFRTGGPQHEVLTSYGQRQAGRIRVFLEI